MHITFRNVTEADEPFEVELFDRTRLSLGNFPDEVRRPLAESQIKLQRAAYQHEFPNAEWLIVLMEGTEVGRYIYEIGESAVLGVDVAILPQYMNRGIGTEIVGHLQSLAKKANRPAVISVDKWNTRAKALYIRLGFVEIKSDLPTHDKMEWRNLAHG